MTTSKQYLAEQISRCISKRRASVNLTLYQVAEKLGIGYEAVSRMERGVTIPTIIRLAELAEIFSCGIEELLIETIGLKTNLRKLQICLSSLIIKIEKCY